MDIKIRQYAEEDVKETIAIWNEVVKEGIAFPQKETLTESTGDLFFKEQTFTGIAYDEEKKEIVGMYILHPNNIGRCVKCSRQQDSITKSFWEILSY